MGGQMRVLTWNVNHRAAQRRIPAWVASTIGEAAPNVVVLTEYVQGRDHDSFLAALGATGLPNVSVTTQPGKQNQVLIATRSPHRLGEIVPPAFHPAITSNVLHVILNDTGVNVLGFRMPDYKNAREADRRQTWEWLLGAVAKLVTAPTVVTGDFNTALGDRGGTGGAFLQQMIQNGWHHARPQTGCSYRHIQTENGIQKVTEREIDHTFLSPKLSGQGAEYRWNFLSHLSYSGRIKVGHPDHAMLIANCGLGKSDQT